MRSRGSFTDEFAETFYGQRSENSDEIGNAVLALTAIFGMLGVALLMYEIFK